MNIQTPVAKSIQVDQHYQLEDHLNGDEVFLTGTQALVRLPLEQARLDRRAGHNTAGFITGYRGSPLAAYDNALIAAGQALKAVEITFKPAINEELAATALFGTQAVSTDPQRTKDGVFGIWYGKGPGVDRSGDALKHGNAFGASSLGGVLALLGDDHGCASSSMPHQSDHALASFMMPVIHPACVEDYIPFGLFGIAASRYSGAWVGMKTISEVVESGATVTVNSHAGFNTPLHYALPSGGLNYDPSRNFGSAMEMRMLDRLDAFRAFARANPIDRAAFGATLPKKAIIAVGKAYFDVLGAFRALGISEAKAKKMGLGVYKVGLVWPIESCGYQTFLQNADIALVVEEKRSFVELHLRTLLNGALCGLILLGKQDASGQPLLPEAGELRSGIVAQALEKVFSLAADRSVATASTRIVEGQAMDFLVAKRSPFFCSGCPHNRSTKLPDSAKAFAGIGCHFMASWMPRNTSGLVQMGGEGVNWIGHSAYTKRSHMFQNLGDGTYFHSGLIAIRATVAAGINITYKILFNDVVAMTGGQAIDGSLRVEDIVAQLRAEGVRRVAVLSENPLRFGHVFATIPGVTLQHRDHILPVQEEMQLLDGVTAIIYDQGCAAQIRRKRKREVSGSPVKRLYINEAVCEGCGDCSTRSNCISIVPKETGWGVKRQIDQSSCNKDFSCVEGFCPSFVSVTGEELKSSGDTQRRAVILSRVSQLPEPTTSSAGEILIAGIGGTGVVTIGAVLAMAAHLEGRGSSVLDFPGFAQKAGAVVSHLKISGNRSQSQPVRIGDNLATTMIACDLVVATMDEALRAASAAGTRIVCNLDTAPTGEFTSYGISDFEEEKRLTALQGVSKALFSVRAISVSVELFGDSVYSNMLLCGYAWQKGLLPVSRQAIERAIELNGRSARQNLDAFAAGRVIAENPDLSGSDVGQSTAPDVDDLIRSRAAFLTSYQNSEYATQFTAFIANVQQAEARLGSHAFTRTVAANLSRLMAYKDEYEVGRLHLDGAVMQSFQKGFARGARMHFHFAPPFLSFLKTPEGYPRKIAIAGTVALPALKLLRSMRYLRGTVFDVFGYTRERRSERLLIAEYRALIERLMTTLSHETLDEAVKIASLADAVRGYGYIKQAEINKYRANLSKHNGP